MPIQIIDDTYAPWVAKKRQENGAATYSRDILEQLIPRITSLLETQHPDITALISTAPPLTDVRREDLLWDDQELVIQFLHTYPYDEPFAPIIRLLDRFPDSRIIVVTAYEAYGTRLRHWAESKGILRLEPVFVPMFINTQRIQEAATRRWVVQPDKRIIYFGNLYGAKSREYDRLSRGIRAAGWTMDVVSKGTFNGRHVLDQEEIWAMIRGYRYGIGVGRCALEMYALDLRVLISGAHWGGICMTREDWATQRRTNFNGRVITGTRDLTEALELLPHSYRLTAKYPAEIHYIRLAIAAILKKNLQPWAAL